ncbi:MAG: hypothetical protein IKQ58_07405 [Prevotella sp.]|nr:hypothetical protein [Prevotella sp.]
MMTDKQINDLLDRFMAGETSEQEERLLTDYFCKRTDVPDEWAAYAVMFRGFRLTAAHEVPIRHYQHRWWMAAAAAILLLLGFWWYMPERESQPETVAKTETPAPKPTAQPVVEETTQQVAVAAETPKPARKVRAAKPHDAVAAEPAEVTVSEAEAVAEVVVEVNDPAADLLNIDMAAVQQQGAELRTALAIMNQELFETE